MIGLFFQTLYVTGVLVQQKFHTTVKVYQRATIYFPTVGLVGSLKVCW
jgi:hypothetical protein